MGQNTCHRSPSQGSVEIKLMEYMNFGLSEPSSNLFALFLLFAQCATICHKRVKSKRGRLLTDVHLH